MKELLSKHAEIKETKPIIKVPETPEVILRNLRAQAEYDILTEKKRQEELRRRRSVKVLSKEEQEDNRRKE